MISRCTLVCVGKPKGWTAQGSEDYANRLRRYFHIDVIEVPEEDLNRRPRQEVLSKEGQRILKSLPTEAYVISLERERGKQYSSERITRKLEDLGVSGRSHVGFIIGGPLGLSPDVLQRSQELWSLGEITLPHALARVVLLEQLYRAAKIHRNEKYHW
ncbi:MAG: 23S rRNA (pseudouridine(1915)-N(3))-methyltransferase RlmH [Rubrobacteraceae bacterium]|nr:23S rRNA (pseudouridine(1915)-N(3))-methyltransferase RlmH [Rubrobacteraceae bacterium]